MRAGLIIVGLGLVVAGGCDGRSVIPGADAAVTKKDGPGRDARTIDGGGACAAFKRYAGGKRIAKHHARRALFSQSRNRVYIVTASAGSSSGDLILVDHAAGWEQKLGSGVDRIEWLGKELAVLATIKSPGTGVTYDLSSFSTSDGMERKLAKDVCHHLASPDGKRIYVVRNCKKQEGDLEVVDLDGKMTFLRKYVDAYSLAASRTGVWTAFVHTLGAMPPGCPQLAGTAAVVDVKGKIFKLGSMVRRSSLQFLPTGELVWARQSCPAPPGNSGVQLRVGVVPPVGTGKNIGTHHNYGYGFIGEYYEASPDGKLILGADMDHRGGPGKLHAVHTGASSSETFLTSDLYNYSMISMAFEAWKFTFSGKHVVYTSRVASSTAPHQMGLSAVPATGGSSVQLTDHLLTASYRLSPVRDEVTYLRVAKQEIELWARPLPAGGSTLLARSSKSLNGIRYTPDGRGLLFSERAVAAGATSTLRYVSRTGAKAQPLGSWNANMLYNSYRVDPESCAVLYNTDLGAEPGVYLRLLPR